MPFACPHCGSALPVLAGGGGEVISCSACRKPCRLPPTPAEPGTTTDDFRAGGDDPARTTDESPARRPSPAGNPPPGYEILGELGRGGMGVVYRARQVRLGRTVALKMILAGGHAGEAELTRFRAEAEAVARLNHPGIVQVYEVGEWQGQPYFALEFCPGGTLSAKVAGTPQPARQAAALAERLAEAVAAAHGAGVVHRDLKPANVLLAADGTPKVADFGLALRLDVDDRQTRTGAVMGTPSYMAPEQALGQTRLIGPAADVYALGAVLYELLTGRPPFKGASVLETLEQVRRQEVVPPSRLNPQVPRDLETVCLKCLRKEPERRYLTARALADDLARFREGRPVVARPVGGVERAAKWVRRNPVVSALAALTVASVLVGLAAFAWQFDKAIDNEKLAEKRAEDATIAEGHALREAAEAKRQKGIAEDSTEKMRVALEEKGRALDDKDRALQASERARANSAVAHAAQVWKTGTPRIARELLDDVPAAFRGWAWNYLERDVQGGLFTAYGNTGPVFALAFSPDGSYLAAVDQAETTREVEHLCVWDAATGVEAAAFRGGRAAGGYAAFTPDGRTLLARRARPNWAGWAVRQWDMATGKESAGPAGWAANTAWVPAVSPDGKRLAGVQFPTGEMFVHGTQGPPLVCAGGPVTAPATRPLFSPDGALLVLAVQGGVRVWDAANGKLLQTLAIGKGTPPVLAFRPDGRSLAVANYEPQKQFAQVSLWDTRTWQARPAFVVPSAHALAFSPDGEWLAVAVGTGEVRLRDVRSGAEVGKLGVVQRGGAAALAFSPDGQRLAVGGADHTVRVWDLRPFAPSPPPVNPAAQPHGAAADGEFRRAAVLTGDGLLRVHDTDTGGELLRIRGARFGSLSFALSPDGTKLAFSPEGGIFGRDVIYVRSVPDNRSLRTVWLPTYPGTVVFSPDGAELSVVASGEGPKRGIHRTVFAGDGQTIWEGSGDQWGVGAMVYSPDGLFFVAGSEDGKIRVWDRKTGRLEATLLGHSDRVNCLAFSADSRLLVSGGRSDRSVILWDFPGRKQLLRRGGHDSGVAHVAVSPDGRLIASRGGAGDVNFWDAVNGQMLLTLDGPRDVTTIGFSRDGGRLLGLRKDGDLLRWDGSPAPVRRTLRGHDNKMHALAFSPDGRTLASFAWQLKWWDTASGRDLFDSGRYLGSFATALAFRPDGRQLGLTTVNRFFEVWDVAGRKKLVRHDARAELWRVALSPEEGVLATWEQSGPNNGALTVWEFPTIRQRFRVPIQAAGFPEISFSADGRLVAATDIVGRRATFDAATGKPVPPPPDFRSAVAPASPVSPDGGSFAHADDDLIHLVSLRPDAAELARRREAARTDRAWQERQAARHEAAGNWFAAAVHLDVLLKATPADAKLKARRDRAAAALAAQDLN